MTVYRLTRWQYRYAKILADFLLMLAGILLGGTIGVGTVISTVAGGFLTQFFYQRSTRLLGPPRGADQLTCFCFCEKTPDAVLGHGGEKFQKRF